MQWIQRGIIFLGLAVAVLLSLGSVAFAAPSADTTVTAREFTFSPTSVTVQVGDTVTWNNTQGFHNVKGDDDGFGNSPASSPWTYAFTFETAGTFNYYCQIHGAPGLQGMAGTVIVEAAPTALTLNELSAGSRTAPVALAALGLGVLVLGALRRQRG